jgi:hypothetical protein
LLVTREQLSFALRYQPIDFLRGLMIRTLPNDLSKKSRRYRAPLPAFFSREAMEYIADLGVQHLLVDLPSVDRMLDEGKLCSHHIFWNVPFDRHDVPEREYSMKTITEMIYVDDAVADGRYLLNLQIPGFAADAAPSRPIVYDSILKSCHEREVF